MAREEDMKHDFYRPPSVNHLQAWIDKDNNPVALSHHVIAPSISAQRSSKKREPNQYDIREGAIVKDYKIPYMQGNRKSWLIP